MELGWRKGFDWNNRFKKQEVVEVNGKEYYISTVDLGLDHSYGKGEPLYYETMVFEKGSPVDLYMERYTTEKQALDGHKRTIDKLKNGTLETY